MSLQQEKIREIADELFMAERNGRTVEQISKRFTEMTIADAYAVQLINMRRMMEEGKKITGKKIGLTSLAMQKSLGVDQPDFGFLFDNMDASAAGVILAQDVLQPRVEGELAFILKKGLSGKVSADEVLQATDYIVPAIEVVDSRIRDWKLTIVDTVADNASCGRYLLSKQRIEPNKTALEEIEMTLWKNGEKVNSGFGNAVMGNPVNAVAWLAACLNEYGVSLDAGDVILSGALSAAVPAFQNDQFICDFGAHGAMKVRFE